MEIATRNVIFPGSVGLAQAHPLTKPPAMREQPDAGLGPVAVHPTDSGVGSRYCFQEIVDTDKLLMSWYRTDVSTYLYYRKRHFEGRFIGSCGDRPFISQAFVGSRLESSRVEARDGNPLM